MLSVLSFYIYHCLWNDFNLYFCCFNFSFVFYFPYEVICGILFTLMFLLIWSLCWDYFLNFLLFSELCQQYFHTCIFSYFSISLRNCLISKYDLCHFFKFPLFHNFFLLILWYLVFFVFYGSIYLACLCCKNII